MTQLTMKHEVKLTDVGHSVSNGTFFGHFCTDPFRFFFIFGTPVDIVWKLTHTKFEISR